MEQYGDYCNRCDEFVYLLLWVMVKLVVDVLESQQAIVRINTSRWHATIHNAKQREKQTNKKDRSKTEKRERGRET